MENVVTAGAAETPARAGKRSVAVMAVVRWLLLAVLLANALGFLLLPVSDPDLFWHLRTGEWILEHRALPGEYLFSLAPPQTAPQAQKFTMTSYWLVQVLLAAAYRAAGFAAVVALRWLLFLLLLLLLARRMRGDALVRLGLLSLAVIVLGQYPAERPQYASFLFAAALLSLLDGLRRTGASAAARWRAACVPPLLALWANCHGGFVVGLGLLGLFAIAESLKLLHPRLAPLPRDRLRLLLAAAAGGLVASLLNPNGWQAFRAALAPATGFVSEYRSTLEGFRVFAEPWIVVYWTLLALAAGGVASRWRTPDLTAIGLVGLTGYFSFTLLRHIPFFLVAALPVGAAALSDPRLVRWTRPGVAALGVSAGIFFLPGTGQVLREARSCAQVNPLRFPVEAAAFVEREGLRGNMFNMYDWGGYLLWRLAPRKSFIDGRGADAAQTEAYRAVLNGDRRPLEGKAAWRRQLDRQGVGFTVTGFFHPYSGRVLGLVDALLAAPDWVPVFASPTSLVFARDAGENRAVIARWALPRGSLYATLLGFTDQLTAAMPDRVALRVARGDLLLRLGDRAAALGSYEQALRIAPANPLARKRVEQLRAGELREPTFP